MSALDRPTSQFRVTRRHRWETASGQPRHYIDNTVMSSYKSRHDEADFHTSHPYRNFATCLRCHHQIKLIRRNIRHHFEQKACQPRGNSAGGMKGPRAMSLKNKMKMEMKAAIVAKRELVVTGQ